jgi:hypothetical protein
MPCPADIRIRKLPLSTGGVVGYGGHWLHPDMAYCPASSFPKEFDKTAAVDCLPLFCTTHRCRPCQGIPDRPILAVLPRILMELLIERESVGMAAVIRAAILVNKWTSLRHYHKTLGGQQHVSVARPAYFRVRKRSKRVGSFAYGSLSSRHVYVRSVHLS